MKIRSRIIAVFLLCLSISTVTFAVDTAHTFYFCIKTTEGYSSDPVWKEAGFGKAMVSIGSTYKDSIYRPSKSDNTRTTNFIIVASDAQQITNAVTIGPGNGTVYPQYYNAAHVGNVILRANSTHSGTGYMIFGSWDTSLK